MASQSGIKAFLLSVVSGGSLGYEDDVILKQCVQRFPVKTMSIHLLCHIETANVTLWHLDTRMALHWYSHTIIY